MSRISVVIPLYNHAEELQLCLTALLLQSPAPDEIIIVDDFSTDHGLFVAQEAAQHHSSIRVVRHETNLGAPAAINTGLMLATSKYVFFAAADDVVLPGLFSANLEQLMLHPEASLCCAQVALADQNLNVTGFRPTFLPIRKAGYISPEQTRLKLNQSDNWLTGQTSIYDRQKLIEVGGFDENIGSLCDGLTSRLMALRYGFCFVPEVLAVWRVVASSLSFQIVYEQSKIEESIELAQKWFDNHVGDIPNWYPTIYERRYRFGTAQIVVSNSERNAFKKTWLLLLLFLKHRPYSISVLANTIYHYILRDKNSAEAVRMALRKLVKNRYS